MSPLLALAATVLPGHPAQLANERSFVSLGGTSLSAMRLCALAAREAGVRIEPARLLGREPLADVLAGATAEPPTVARLTNAGTRDALPGQAGMLHIDAISGSSAYHLLFTAEIRGAAPDEVAAALGVLVARHEALRTMFEPPESETGRPRRRVLDSAEPLLRRQVLRLPDDVDPVAAVHAQLGPASIHLLRPMRRPAVYFQLTEVTPRLLLSIVAHHALLDGWSVGVLFTELADILAGNRLESAPSAEPLLSEVDVEAGPRVAQLAGAPDILELPSDLSRPAQQDYRGTRLPAALGPHATEGWQRVAAELAVSPTTVLLAAYALVLARRAAVSDLLVGVPAVVRPGADGERVVALTSRLLPVRCRLAEQGSVRAYVLGVADALATALASARVPFEELLTATGTGGDRRRSPLVQFVLGVHDELVPQRIQRGPVELELHEGHCGGSPYDATLYLQRGAPRPWLVLEYATAVLAAGEAADLLDAVDTALVELAGGLDAPLGEVRTISTAQHTRLTAARHGPPVPEWVAGDADVWSLVAASARANPDAVAVIDGDREVRYGELVALVRAQAALLTRAGVGDGDCVLIAVPRSAAEVVAVLAVLAVGAHYLSLDQSTPDIRLRAILDIAAPRAILADPRNANFAERVSAMVDVVRVAVAGSAEAPELPALAPDGGRTAYLAFTSGSTGVPKGVRVPHRAVVRLVLPGPQCCVQCGPGERMLRFAPLAFDASTLELFAPLAAGGALVVHPDGLPAPADLADFLVTSEVSVLWLTAGLFRVVADFAPHAFAGVGQLLVGGDVVPVDQVRTLCARYPDLRISNGYGPTENTTFSTVHQVRGPADVDDPLPIGTAIAGSGTIVLDQHGRPVPPGGVGELHVTGLGLADDYVGAPTETVAAFGVAPDTGERVYRTGDIVRLDGAGRFRYLGRRDHQVKIRGFRIELDEIQRALAGLAGVRDAVVVAIGPDASTRQLLAAVVPAPGAGLVPDLLSSAVAAVLPGYAVPALWAVIDEIPVTRNGKVDRDALERAAHPAESTPDTGGGEPDLAVTAWTQVLGRPPSRPDSDFFREGGDSLTMARLIAWLTKEHGVRIPIREFYSAPTPNRLRQLIESSTVPTGEVGVR